MKLLVPNTVMQEISKHGEGAYPEEGAGLILGTIDSELREARRVLPLSNSFEADARSHRYSLDPLEVLQAEELAVQLGLDVIGVFHSHPDHPPAPSQFDLDRAVPWYIYLITAIRRGSAGESRVWSLAEDHSKMIEAELEIMDGEE